MAQGWKKSYSRYKGFFLDILTIYQTKPNTKIYLELILSLGTIILFSIFAIKPTILTIIDLNNEIKSKESTVLKLKQKIIDLKTASNILQEESQNLKLIDLAVPSNADVEQLISQVEKTAIANLVEIKNISFSNVFLINNSDKNVKSSELTYFPDNSNELPINFSLIGPYQNLFQFLQSAENLVRPIKIDSLIFNSSNTIDDKKVIILTVSGRVPYAQK